MSSLNMAGEVLLVGTSNEKALRQGWQQDHSHQIHNQLSHNDHTVSRVLRVIRCGWSIQIESGTIDQFYELVGSGIGILHIVLAASKAGFSAPVVSSESCKTQQHPTRKQGDPGIWQRSKELLWYQHGIVTGG